jgi:uncharacterized protein (TIGR03066 family)
MNLSRLVALACITAGLAMHSPLSGNKARSAPAPRPKTNAEKILGTWKVVKVPAGQLQDVTIEFTKDGKAKIVMRNETEEQTREATFKVDGDKVTITVALPDGKARKDTLTIVKLTDAELHLKGEPGVLELKKEK